MAGQTTVNVVQLGDSATASQNFHLRTNVDGTLSLNRGNVGASLGNILQISSGTETVQRIMTFTPIVAANQTSMDFTGIPSWAKEITVMLNGISTNGTSDVIAQLGTTSGIEAVGYLGSTGETTNVGSGTTSFTTGIGCSRGTTAATVRQGNIFIVQASSNVWIASVSSSRSDATVAFSGGSSKTLSGTLDRLRITTVNGTDQFDAGSVNILVKG